MAWISFEDIKKTVSLEMVLNHYGVNLRKVGEATLRGKCPLPTHGSDKSKASFTVTLTKGVSGVWACQSDSCVAARDGKKGGNALDLVAAMEACSIRDAAAKMQTWFSVPPAARSATEVDEGPEKPAERVSKKNTEAAEEGNKPMTFELKGIDPAHPYLSSRGVDEATASAFGIGHFPGRGSMCERIVFPIHNENGGLVAYAGRSVDDGSEPRYKFPAGFHKSLELYNLHRAIGEHNPLRWVVVVEGFFDCLKVSAAGFPCVALMGSAMSKAQEDLLVRHFKGAWLLLDGDEAGHAAAEDGLTRLGWRMWVRAVALPGGKQPDMLTTEEIQALVKQ